MSSEDNRKHFIYSHNISVIVHCCKGLSLPVFIISQIWSFFRTINSSPRFWNSDGIFVATCIKKSKGRKEWKSWHARSKSKRFKSRSKYVRALSLLLFLSHFHSGNVENVDINRVTFLLFSAICASKKMRSFQFSVSLRLLLKIVSPNSVENPRKLH